MMEGIMKKNETIALFIGLFSEMLFGASFVFIKMVPIIAEIVSAIDAHHFTATN